MTLTLRHKIIFTSVSGIAAPPAETSTVPGRLLIDSVKKDECEADDYPNPSSTGHRLVAGAITDRVRTD